MRHTVLMLVHKDLERVKASADWFLRHDVSLVVHVDRKQPEIQNALEKYFEGKPLACIVSNPVNVNWSGVSIIEAETLMIEMAAKDFPDSDYYHLISGECQALLPPDSWAQLLDGKSYLECEHLPEYEWRIRRFMPFGETPRNRTLPYRLMSRLLRESQRVLPLRKNFGAEAKLKGSQWFSLNRIDFMKVRGHLTHSFLKRFRLTRCADEHFLQIIFDRLNVNFHRKNLMYTLWTEGKASPEYLTVNQLLDARESGCYLFARKVDGVVSKEYSEEMLR